MESQSLHSGARISDDNCVTNINGAEDILSVVYARAALYAYLRIVVTILHGPLSRGGVITAVHRGTVYECAPMTKNWNNNEN